MPGIILGTEITSYVVLYDKYKYKCMHAFKVEKEKHKINLQSPGQGLGPRSTVQM